LGKKYVYELARELNISSKELLKHLHELNIRVKSHASTLDEENYRLVKELLGEEKKVRIQQGITVRELAQKLSLPPEKIISYLLKKGIMVTINQSLGKDLLEKLSQDFSFQVEEKKKEEPKRERKEEELLPRPPVVTVMGHVDHGKTTLLDAIRKTRVVEQEYGEITQHIGAYQVKLPQGVITFLDTPGHEAFTTLRARGAQVTDIVVLVVAADDGVMPQTKEAIDHARAAQVPIIVAINKIDKPNANPSRVRNQLIEVGLIPEEMGGDTVVMEISALKKKGIEDLLEMILLQAEMQELKANPHRRGEGVIIETRVDKGKGPVGTVLVTNGTLRVGDAFVAGSSAGKVRALLNDKGEKVKEAPPSTPVEVVGFEELPQAGDKLEVVKNEREARKISEERKRGERKGVERPLLSLEEVMKRMGEEEKVLKIIIKGDVQGSVEALDSSIANLSSEEMKIEVIHRGIGNISRSDVLLASASQALILGFNVGIEPNVSSLAKGEGVEIRLYRVIYEVIQDLEGLIRGRKVPEKEEVKIGEAEVRKIFPISRIGNVAGCYVKEGKVVRGSKCRVLRGEEEVYQGTITSLKRFKDDVKEVGEGYECGIKIEGLEDIQEGDVIEVFGWKEKI